MNKPLKLLSLLLLSLSVYFIYQKNNNYHIKIVNIGDAISEGITSYKEKEYSHIDYYKEYLEKQNKTVDVTNHTNKELSLKEVLDKVKNNPNIKRDLNETHLVFITIGYNDLIYKTSLEDNLDNKKLNIIIKEISDNYQELITEIRKYYKRKIYVIGYFQSNKDDYYINKGIKMLNNILENNSEITYIDTYNLLNNRRMYFSNPKSYYPNQKGYYAIFNTIKEINT